MTLAGKHYLAGLVWAILLGIVYLVIDSQIKPKVAIATGNAAEVVIPRSRDGHFYVTGQVNGQPVTFMVDTGASTVAVSDTVARRISLPAGKPVMIGTAGGSTRGVEVTGQTVALSDIVVNDARIVILPQIPG